MALRDPSTKPAKTQDASEVADTLRTSCRLKASVSPGEGPASTSPHLEKTPFSMSREHILMKLQPMLNRLARGADVHGSEEGGHMVQNDAPNVPPPATAIMLKKKGIYGHPEEGILHASRARTWSLPDTCQITRATCHERQASSAPLWPSGVGGRRPLVCGANNNMTYTYLQIFYTYTKIIIIWNIISLILMKFYTFEGNIIIWFMIFKKNRKNM